MSISLPISSGTIGNISQLTVDARSLHEVLEVKRDFSTWIKGRISKYSFKENEDFVIFTKSGENSERGRNSIEYRLSVNMGKELAMVENNERGRMVRRYFIECERRLMETPAPALPAPAAPPLSTTSDRRNLNNLVRRWAALSGLSFPDCWAEIHVTFDIGSASDLPCTRVKEAEAWVQARIDALPALPEPAPSWPMELANYGRKGNAPVNLWDDLKEAERILKSCSTGVMLACNSCRSLYMTPEKHLFYDMLQKALNHAEASLMMTRQAVDMCFSLKGEVDFFKA